MPRWPESGRRKWISSWPSWINCEDGNGSPRVGTTHALKGLQDCRECHVQPDWLLIYSIDSDAGELILIRTGSHADLFEK